MTIETLAPAAMSVVSVGDTPRDFAGWQRVLQRLFAKAPALYDGLTTVALGAAIAAACEDGEVTQLTIRTGSGPHQVKLHPVVGPTGGVHAVRLWLGPASVEPPPVPEAAGVVWDAETQTLLLSREITRLVHGVSDDQYVPRISVAEFFQQVSFDRHADMLDLFYSPEPDGRLQCDVAVGLDTDRPAKWRITGRYRPTEHGDGAWLLIEAAISDDRVARPTLERAGLREAHRRSGTYLAVIQLEHANIAHWLTDPAPWIRWDYLFRPADVFHPDDRDRLIGIGDRLGSGDTAGITVRTLGYWGGYSETSLLLSAYPECSNRQRALAQLVSVAGYLPTSPPQAREDVAALAVRGYDDQLRHRRGGMSRTAMW
ncbi:hypothetical protein D5S18_00935 [Nocardia panacis]|uniref:Rv3651-like N-terminal domain-containing protein n=1 Tax=Nocardia panacis TaxID=2340916 RepID=A0A3A4KJ21_9NOCA|nr:GAF domain-containing protein [Nocardia panacis]RJO79870.1 hypothetical protein D5S18_00935 [Nocardia panacis]